MLIARAPVRVSFGGGGTDLAAYYQPYGGMVVSAAINKYFYTMISAARPGDSVQIVSSDYHTFYRHDLGQPVFWKAGLELPRAVLSHFGVEREYNVFLASEVPPGTGLGSSGSVAVTLVRALSTLCDIPLSRRSLRRGGPAVAILWGSPARTLAPFLGGMPRIESPHPSPLSAHRGFFGSRPFSRANDLLARQGADPIDWSLP